MDYQVGINTEAAFSVFYEDAHGRMYFSIEVDDDPKKIYLNPRPSERGMIVSHDDASQSARIRLAVARLKAHFEGQGLSVEID